MNGTNFRFIVIGLYANSANMLVAFKHCVVMH